MEIDDDVAVKPALGGDLARRFPAGGRVAARGLDVDQGGVRTDAEAFAGDLEAGIGIGFAHDVDAAIDVTRRPRGHLGAEDGIAGGVARGIPQPAAGEEQERANGRHRTAHV